MSKSTSQLTALYDLAVDTYHKEGRNRHDLDQCETLLLEALDGREDIYGADSEWVGQVHNWLGIVYAAMDDHFEEGEAHYHKAAQIYKSKESQAIVANNHANLLTKKAKLIMEECDDVAGDYDNLREPAPEPATQGLRRLLQTGKDKSSAPATGIKDQKLSKMRSLAELRDEAREAFKKADEFRAKALTLTTELFKAQQKEVEGLKPAKKSANTAPTVYKSPADIVAILDKVAIGQRAAKRGLANAASQHIRRMQLKPEVRANTEKSNVLMLGPTGCGKTLLARGLASAINVPFYGTEATKLTAAGYVGEDVQAIIYGLLAACDFDVERAQNGIIYLDEVDKIAAVGDGHLDVGGESVQEELLTILEGTTVSVPRDGNKKGNGERIEVDTTNILFVLGGAFTGLDKIVEKRLASGGSKIGFGADVRAKEEDTSHCLSQVTAADFVEFGMIPEFIGRIPKRLVIEKLTVDQLERILVEPDKALVAQKRLLLAAATDLRFSRGALRAIAEEAHKTGTHGRALREIVEQVLEPIVFDEPAVAIITAEMVTNRNAEINAKNREDDGVKVSAERDFIVDDNDVERVREEAEAAARQRQAQAAAAAPGETRALTVIRN